MAVVKLELTEDILKLVSCIRFKELPIIEENSKKQYLGYEIDMNSLYGGDFLFEDISFILGRENEVIPDTEEDYDGPKYPKEFENYMLDIHTFIVDHLDMIEEIVHQFMLKGGVTPGTYKCKDWQRIWSKVEKK